MYKKGEKLSVAASVPLIDTEPVAVPMNTQANTRLRVEL